jgi:hypothetical protein
LDEAECRMDCTTSGTDDAAPASGDWVKRDAASIASARMRSRLYTNNQFLLCGCQAKLSEDLCWADSMPQSSPLRRCFTPGAVFMLLRRNL